MTKGEIMLIDTHCHLNDELLEKREDEIVGSFLDDGIECAVCVGYDLPSSFLARDIAARHDRVWFAAGIHPHDSDTADDEKYAAIRELASDKKAVAIGEIGLDYYYDNSIRELQKKAFQEQIELANEVNLPIVLHIRDAYEDARKILFDMKSYINCGLLLHCYSGSPEYVKIFDKLDAYYSFGGAITFKNAKHNIESLKSVPIDRLVLETDCPYMTPVPFRGKTNEPKYVNLVADKASEVLEISRERIDEITTQNAKRLFYRIK